MKLGNYAGGKKERSLIRTLTRTFLSIDKLFCQLNYRDPSVSFFKKVGQR